MFYGRDQSPAFKMASKTLYHRGTILLAATNQNHVSEYAPSFLVVMKGISQDVSQNILITRYNLLSTGWRSLR